MDWDDFEFRIRVSQRDLTDLLIEMEAHRRSIQKLRLLPEWAEDLKRLNIIRAVHGTTAIEGNPLTEEEVGHALAEGSQRGHGNGLAERQVQNAYKAHQWVQETFGPPSSKQVITLDDILTIHRLLTESSDEADNQPGRLRDEGHNVTAGSPELGGIHRGAPGGQRLQRIMDQYIDFLRSSDFQALNPVEQALCAHFYLVSIHPFGNGNGRTARSVEAAILFMGGYNTHGFFSLSNHFYTERESYIRLLQRTRTELAYDLTEFFKFGLTGFVAELDRISSYVRRRMERLLYSELIRKGSERRVGKRRRLLNSREGNLLRYLLDLTPPPSPFSNETEPSVLFSNLVGSAFFRANYGSVTRRTVLRELRRLSDLGYIRYMLVPGTGDDLLVELSFDAITKPELSPYRLEDVL